MKKQMKKLFLSLVATMMVTMNYAQSNLVATLSHKGEVSVFHGINSLKQAMEAADHGDIITLASGRYNAANITKAVTLRGAGIEENDINTGTARTQIVGDSKIAIPDTKEHLTIEGIYIENSIRLEEGSLNNAMFQKCWISLFYCLGSKQGVRETYLNSLTCIHCNIGNISLNERSSCSAKFINCVVNSPVSSYKTYDGYMEFTNCMILGSVNSVYKSYFQNCILNITNKLPSTNMATYCAGYTSDEGGSPFANLTTQATNKVLTKAQMDALFKPDTFYELTDEAKEEYVGQDEKEMGIYGGNLPYETRILSPQITKCNVAAKTTADGKLSVDIEVKAAE